MFAPPSQDNEALLRSMSFSAVVPVFILEATGGRNGREPCPNTP